MLSKSIRGRFRRPPRLCRRPTSHRCCIASDADAGRVRRADQATPPPLNKAIADKVAGAGYVQVPGFGHCPPMEQPEQFLAAIRDFVAL